MIDTTHPAPPTAAFRRPEQWRERDWQEAAHTLIVSAADRLWTDVGRVGLDWLRAEGLRDATIKRFLIGWIDAETTSQPLEAMADRKGPQPIRLGRGITIPHAAVGAWYGRKIGIVSDDGFDLTRWAGAGLLPFDGDRPAQAVEEIVPLTGSAVGHLYPHPDPTPGRPLLIVANLLDALIGFERIEQHAEVAEVATIIGGKPNRAALEAMAGCSTLIIATPTEDADGPLVHQWREWSPNPAKVHGLAVPPGGLRAHHGDGGNLAGWARAGLKRIGIRP